MHLFTNNITWYDNKPINLLSTMFSPLEMNDVVFVKKVA